MKGRRIRIRYQYCDLGGQRLQNEDVAKGMQHPEIRTVAKYLKTLRRRQRAQARDWWG